MSIRKRLNLRVCFGAATKPREATVEAGFGAKLTGKARQELLLIGSVHPHHSGVTK
jgi:hypothetical protein